LEVKWAQRVGRSLIRRLYESESKDLIDEALLDDVGTRFAMRCEAVLSVAEAKKGRVACPRCAASGHATVIIRISGGEDELLRCPACGWAATWGAYYSRCRRRQLNEGGAGYAFRSYLSRWAAAKTPAGKMIAVDQLIHEFHVYLMRNRRTGKTEDKHCRSVAVHLIEGKLAEVVAFLEELAGHKPRMPELSDAATTWRSNIREGEALYRDGEWKEWRMLGPSRD
jgi:hypothetical protein